MKIKRMKTKRLCFPWEVSWPYSDVTLYDEWKVDSTNRDYDVAVVRFLEPLDLVEEGIGCSYLGGRDRSINNYSNHQQHSSIHVFHYRISS
mmetsp:Transcript_17704/g.27107  ORF Transcript_17704/g.27107 Transcript_17704/m.27107 type:complete len:91 (-) Transcript_17704:173-445(-)